jgi:hypothetical protein
MLGNPVIGDQFGFGSDVPVTLGDRRIKAPKLTIEHDHDEVADELTLAVSRNVHVDEGATIQRVVARITARPPGRVSIQDVAEVRASGAASAVVDFGRMRTVGELEVADAGVALLSPWLGAAYGPNVAPSGWTTEVMTERVMCTPATNGAVDLTRLGISFATLPGGPADVELLVGGRRVFFQSGEVKRAKFGAELLPELGEVPDVHFVAGIDITEAVLASRPGPTGDIAVELRAASYGRCSLAIHTVFTRVHTVAFPGGEQAVTLASEGDASLVLPLPSTATSWSVTGAALTVAARLDGVRTLPATGPVFSEHAQLILDADHPVAILVPASAGSAFGHLTAVRLPLIVEDGGGELLGTLLADDGGNPGEPLPGGAFTPLGLTPRAAIGWETLALVRPMVRPAGACWLSLQVGHGKLRMALGTGADARILRGRPGLPWRTFSASAGFQPTAALRVSGTATDGQTLYAIAGRFDGEAVSVVVPTADGARLELEAAAPPSLPLTVKLTATAVFYRLPTDS